MSINMPSIVQLAVIGLKVSQLFKVMYATDGRTDGQTDGWLTCQTNRLTLLIT